MTVKEFAFAYHDLVSSYDVRVLDTHEKFLRELAKRLDLYYCEVERLYEDMLETKPSVPDYVKV